jgi:hypothetical protein
MNEPIPNEEDFQVNKFCRCDRCRTTPTDRFSAIVLEVARKAHAAREYADKLQGVINERDEALAVNIASDDFMAFMSATLADFPCCHEKGEHDGTPPMMWSELIQCIIRKAVETETARIRDALEFYANPETYHAIMVMGDSPCGDFVRDLSDDHGHPDYDGPRFGKAARAALKPTP